MQQEQMLSLKLRHWVLEQDANGHNTWRKVTTLRTVAAAQTAVLICDMWDRHWSRGATERVDAMAPRINEVIKVVRAKDARVIHAPSNTLDFYAGTPARQRAFDAPYVAPPPPIERPTQPLPIDDSDEGSDTGEAQPYKAWSRQHPAIEIDQTRDAITDDGQEVYNLLHVWGVRHVLIMGVHANMCILNRSFSIKQIVKWGVDIALVHDLTDTMYNPAMPPYVNHDEGTRLVVVPSVPYISICGNLCAQTSKLIMIVPIALLANSRVPAT